MNETHDNKTDFQQDIVHPAYTQIKPHRTFTAVDSAFAWLSFAAGYVFCRVFPVSSNSFGGFLFVLALFLVTAVSLKLKGMKFSVVPLMAAASAVAVSAALILSENSFLCFFAYSYALAAYCYFLYAIAGNSIEKGFSDLIAVDFFKAMFVVPFYSFHLLFKGMFSGKAKGCGKIILKLLTGIFAAIIPTAVVLVLLSYDKDFYSLLTKIFDFNLWDIFSNIISLIFAIPVGMYIFGLFVSSAEHKGSNVMTAQSCRESYKKIKIAPVVTVLSAVVPLLCIYVIFFISQWKYYISGFTGILPDQFSYAEYARQGFFQLCAVSVINFLVILSVVLFMRRSNRSSTVILKILSVIYSLFTLVLISTALAKMIMYINCYGLTPKRVYATWLMLVLAITFIIIIVKQFVPKLNALAASLAVGIVMFAVLSLSNTDGLIARYNVERYIEGSLETVDMDAMDELGIAAIPELVHLAEFLDEKNGTDIADAPGIQSEDDLYGRLACALRNEAEYMETHEKEFFDFSVPYVRAENALRKIGLVKEA